MQCSVSIGGRLWLFFLIWYEDVSGLYLFLILPCSSTIFEKNTISFVSASINDSFTATAAFLKFLDPWRSSFEPFVAKFSIVIWYDFPMISGVTELRALEIMSHISWRDGFGVPAGENQNDKGINKETTIRY